MTVRELIDRLQREDPNNEVLTEYQTGDYWNTLVCSEVRAVQTLGVKANDYHRKLEVVGDEDEVTTVATIIR